jgi:hypothetical protein
MHWTEQLKNIIQAIALIIGGLWAIFLYLHKDVFLQEERPNLYHDLRWEEGDTHDKCKAVFKVILENKGTTSFDISQVRIRRWLFSKTRQESDSSTLLDVNTIINREPLNDETYSLAKVPRGKEAILPLIGHYPPESAKFHDFEWELKYDSTQRVLFLVNVYIEGQDKGTAPVHTAQWSDVCAFPSKSSRQPDQPRSAPEQKD